MFRRINRIFALLMITCMLTACTAGPGREETADTTAATTAEADTTTKEEETTYTPAVKGTLLDEISEDEMFVIYEKPIYDDFTPPGGPFVVLGKGGETLFRLENAMYEGPVGLMKKSRPLAVGQKNTSSSPDGGSTTRYGLYLVSEGRYVLEPKYTRVYVAQDPGGYVYYTERDGYRDFDDYIEGRETIEDKPDYLMIGDHTYEGYNCCTDGTNVWIQKDMEHVLRYRDGELVEEYEGVEMYDVMNDRVILLPSDYENTQDPEKISALYAIDGTLIFRLSDWKEKHPSQWQLMLTQYNEDKSLIVIHENGPEQRDFLINDAGEILNEIVQSGAYYNFPPSDTEYYGVDTWGEEGEESQTVWYYKDGREVLDEDGTPCSRAIGYGWFVIEKDNEKILLHPEEGKRLSFEAGSEFWIPQEGLILQTLPELGGEGTTVVRNNDGEVLLEGKYMNVMSQVPGRLCLLQMKNEDMYDYGYGTWYLLDGEGNLIYQSGMRERLIYADERFSIAMRGNYLCAFDKNGAVLFKELGAGMGED